MALFFMYGRKSHRQHERFDAELDCLIEYGNRRIKTKTKNISEKGIAVELDFPEYIPPDETVVIKMATDRYAASWQGKVANVVNINNRWRYGFFMTEISDVNYREMLQIVS